MGQFNFTQIILFATETTASSAGPPPSAAQYVHQPAVHRNRQRPAGCRAIIKWPAQGPAALAGGAGGRPSPHPGALRQPGHRVDGIHRPLALPLQAPELLCPSPHIPPARGPQPKDPSPRTQAPGPKPQDPSPRLSIRAPPGPAAGSHNNISRALRSSTAACDACRDSGGAACWAACAACWPAAAAC